LIHITYASILNAKNENGNHLFKNKIYYVLFEYEKNITSPSKDILVNILDYWR